MPGGSEMASIFIWFSCRFGPRDKIDPSNDYTRLTLDAISLCSMSYR